MQLPHSDSTDVEVWSEVALIFGTDDSKVGEGATCVVIGNDAIVPLGENVRRELGDCCCDNRLEDVMDADGARLDLSHVWLNCQIRECVLDERVRVRFQDGVACRGNGVTD